MNKEELREEATKTVEWECTPMIDRPTFINGYIIGAELREKHIAELEADNAELKKDKQNLRADLRTARNNLQAKDTAYQLAMEELNYAKTHCLFHSDCSTQKENAELKSVLLKCYSKFFSNAFRTCDDDLLELKGQIKKLLKE